jgi:hypothetical protein
VRRPRPLALVVPGLAIVAVLLGDVVALVRHDTENAAVAAVPALRVVAAEASATAQRLRGLQLRRRVTVVSVKAAAMARLVSPPPGQVPLVGEVAVLAGLGLLGGESSDLETASRSISSDVAGYYDPDKSRVVVREDLDAASLRVTLVHELTHALDDQHFGLRTRPGFGLDESAETLRALVEGDAVWVERHAEPQPSESAGSAPPSSLPPALVAYASYPYEAGYEFVDALRARGGIALLNRAFRHPPTTSAEILQPQRYGQQSLNPREIERPQPGGRVVGRGTFGELLVYLTLRSALPRDSARSAAAAWAAGRYVAYLDGDTVCVRVRLAAVPGGQEELTGGVARWANGRQRVSVQPAGATVQLQSCDRPPAGFRADTR